MQTVQVGQMQQLFAAMKDGQIRPEHLHNFLQNPDSVFGFWKEHFIGLKAINSRVHKFPPRLVNGEAFYAVYSTEDEGFYVIWGKSKSELYSELRNWEIIDGKMFIYGRQGQEWKVQLGDERFEIKDEPLSAQYIVGKLLYKATRGEKWVVVWGDEESQLYDDIKDESVVEGKLFFCAKKGLKWVVVWGEKESDAHHEIKDASIVDGKFFYCASDVPKWFVVWGDKRSPKEWGYYEIDQPQVLGGKILFVAYEGDLNLHKRIIVWGEEEIGGCLYDAIWNVRLFDNKLFYCERSCGSCYMIWGDGDEVIDITYSNIWNVGFVNGKLLYKASYAGKGQFIVFGEEESKRYDEIFSLHVEDDQIVFGAHRGRKLFRVTRTIG